MKDAYDVNHKGGLLTANKMLTLAAHPDRRVHHQLLHSHSINELHLQHPHPPTPTSIYLFQHPHPPNPAPPSSDSDSATSTFNFNPTALVPSIHFTQLTAVIQS